MIELLRNHLKKNEKLISLLSDNNSIFHIVKPLQYNADDYIVIQDTLIEDNYIKRYRLEFNIISKDLNKVLNIEKELISYLHDNRDNKVIKNENNAIRNIKVLNSGGTIQDDSQNWIRILYFLCLV